MEHLTDKELISLLEALHIATYVTVCYPPLERSRLYLESKKLWDALGHEAISRGIHEYSEYHPGLLGVYAGKRLDTGSDVEKAIAHHETDRFWHYLTEELGAFMAAELVDDYLDMSKVDQIPHHMKMKRKIEELIECDGLESIIDVEYLRKELMT